MKVLAGGIPREEMRLCRFGRVTGRRFGMESTPDIVKVETVIDGMSRIGESKTSGATLSLSITTNILSS